MKCSGCQHDNAEGAARCDWCDGVLYDHSWHVWRRYMRENDTPMTAWHSEPKKYRSERAARMAERDLNVAYTFQVGRVQHIALPRGVHPRDLYL
jgi:hypothetical protein